MHQEKELIERIKKLKDEKRAVILAHYYQEGEIQDIADFVGDSLGLSQKAVNTESDIIVFAGVHFMAETAKILNPHKKVLIPDLEAGCSLAESCEANNFKDFIARHPGHVVISYINCTAEVKALSDLICTSSNAVQVINSVPKGKPIIFAPDINLGLYLQRATGREMVLWDGSCIVHHEFSEETLRKLKLEYPDAKVIAHPECSAYMLELADFIGSTAALLKFAQKDPSEAYIVATEMGLLHQMRKACPEKKFIMAPVVSTCTACQQCPYMKMNTLEKLYLCLENESPEVTVSEQTSKKALRSIDRMMKISLN